MEKLPEKWYWIAILILLSISLYTAWYLQLNPQHIPLFLTTTIIAIGFVVAMALLPKYRKRFAEKIMAYHDKKKSLGALYRYKNVALALIDSALRTPSISTFLSALSYSNRRRSVHRRHSRKETQMVLAEENLEICGGDSGVSVPLMYNTLYNFR